MIPGLHHMPFARCLSIAARHDRIWTTYLNRNSSANLPGSQVVRPHTARRIDRENEFYDYETYATGTINFKILTYSIKTEN